MTQLKVSAPLGANKLFQARVALLNMLIEAWLKELSENAVRAFEEVLGIKTRFISYLTKLDEDFYCLVEVENELVQAKVKAQDRPEKEGWYQISYDGFLHGEHRVKVLDEIYTGIDKEEESKLVNAIRILYQMRIIRTNPFHPDATKGTLKRIADRASELTLRIKPLKRENRLVWTESDQIQTFIPPKGITVAPEWASYDDFRPTERIVGMKVDKK